MGSLTIADQVMGLTGVSFTGSVGTITPADQVVGLTGQEATVSVGIPFIKAYADIDTGSNTSYSNISTGSNTSYSDVATGPNTSYNVAPNTCLLYTSPSPRDGLLSRMPSSA